MKIWNEVYTENMKAAFLAKLPVKSDVHIFIRNILTKKVNRIDKADWALLTAAKICNGIGNWLIPGWFRRFLAWLLPFLKANIHDLNYSLGGTWKDRLKADWGLVKYSWISIYMYFKNKKYVRGTICFIIGAPIILLFFIIVILFGWTSFNFLKK